MPYQQHDSVRNDTLKHLQYGFFTTEEGASDGGFLINDKPTRNVNLFAKDDNPQSISNNITRCIEEMYGPSPADLQTFFMTTSYAPEGEANIVVINSDNLNELAASDLPPKLSSTTEFTAAFAKHNIAVLEADALVLANIPDRRVFLCGASGDAHPIIIIDDKNKVCAYVAGSHAGIHAHVIEQVVEQMLVQGAELDALNIIIGPGLGKRSYEFGTEATVSGTKTKMPTVDYFAGAKDCLIPVTDSAGNERYLVQLADMIRLKATDLGLSVEQVHDMEIDTMMYDLYVESESGELTRRDGVDFEAINESWPLFFGARRRVQEMKDDVAAENPGLHNKAGRHLAGVGFTAT